MRELYVGQQECVLYSMVCVHRVCICDNHPLLFMNLWFNKQQQPCSDVYSDNLKIQF